jgi:hypothetical protein
VSTEQTSLKHARAIVAELFPGAHVLGSQKRVQYRHGGKHPFTISEDLVNGCFDMVVLAPHGLLCLQITSPTNASARRQKINSQLGAVPPYVISQVWAWKAGKEMMVWEKCPALGQEWRRCPSLESPLIKSKPPTGTSGEGPG